MKAIIANDTKKRKRFLKTELTQKVLKSLSKAKTLTDFQQWWIPLHQTNFLQSSRVKIHNRCVLTGRGASVSRYYQLSRIQFRELGRSGQITGLQKSSW
jgi:small subunit ribosomal protein S14